MGTLEAAEPHMLPVFADATWSEAWPMENDQVPADLVRGAGNAYTDQMGRICIIRHARTVNVSFFDGHAENVKLPQLWALPWHALWHTPNPLPIVP